MMCQTEPSPEILSKYKAGVHIASLYDYNFVECAYLNGIPTAVRYCILLALRMEMDKML